jgi:hypothetical protein
MLNSISPSVSAQDFSSSILNEVKQLNFINENSAEQTAVQLNIASEDSFFDYNNIMVSMDTGVAELDLANLESDNVAVVETAGTVQTDYSETNNDEHIQDSVQEIPNNPKTIIEGKVEKEVNTATVLIPSLPNTRAISAHIKPIEKLLKNEKIIGHLVHGNIVSSPPLITRYGNPVIRRGTINVIQGAQGSHKSRLAGALCSLILSKKSSLSESLGFEKFSTQEITAVYIDTERNMKEEFAEAIQCIMLNAGYQKNDELPTFRFTSIKDFERKSRLDAIKIYLKEVHHGHTKPLVIFLDVVTDCIANFNDPVESMELLDFLGICCEAYNSTFFLLIHENPGSSKARGHAGTEAINKASYVCQIGFEKNGKNEVTDLLWLKEIKTRHSQKAAPLALQFDPDTKSLKTADEVLIKTVTDLRRTKADVQDIANKLSSCIAFPYSQKDLLDLLEGEFVCSPNTLKTRLQELSDTKLPILNKSAETCFLKIVHTNGKPTIYELVNERTEDSG